MSRARRTAKARRTEIRAQRPQSAQRTQRFIIEKQLILPCRFLRTTASLVTITHEYDNCGNNGFKALVISVSSVRSVANIFLFFAPWRLCARQCFLNTSSSESKISYPQTRTSRLSNPALRQHAGHTRMTWLKPVPWHYLAIDIHTARNRPATVPRRDQHQ